MGRMRRLRSGERGNRKERDVHKLAAVHWIAGAEVCRCHVNRVEMKKIMVNRSLISSWLKLTVKKKLVKAIFTINESYEQDKLVSHGIGFLTHASSRGRLKRF